VPVTGFHRSSRTGGASNHDSPRCYSGVIRDVAGRSATDGATARQETIGNLSPESSTEGSINDIATSSKSLPSGLRPGTKRVVALGEKASIRKSVKEHQERQAPVDGTLTMRF